MHEYCYVQFQEYKTNHPILAMDSRRTTRFLRFAEFKKAKLDDKRIVLLNKIYDALRPGGIHICLELYYIYEKDVRLNQYVTIDKDKYVDVVRI